MEDMPYIIADLIIAVLGFGFVYYYSRQTIKEAKRKRGLREKLNLYKKALYMPWIILEIIIVFSIVCYTITGELFFICVSIFLLVELFLHKPSLSNLVERLDMPLDEQRILENPESAI